MTSPPLDASGSEPGAAHLATRYLDALRAASFSAAAEVVDEALSRGLSAAAVHSDVIEPALVAIGDLWASGALTVGDEHLATAITERILARLAVRLRTAPRSSRERVLLAAPAGERHDVGLRMAGDVLEGAGFDVLYLGPDVPAGALAATVAEHRPAVTGLTCTCSGEALVDSIEAIAASTRIVLGGEGVPLWLRDAGHPWLTRSRSVVTAVEELLSEPLGPSTLPARTSRRPQKRSDNRTLDGGFPLTPRQREVLAGLAQGKSTEQIATDLVLTPVTVRNHIANILTSLGVHSRLEAVVAAATQGSRRLGARSERASRCSKRSIRLPPVVRAARPV